MRCLYLGSITGTGLEFTFWSCWPADPLCCRVFAPCDAYLIILQMLLTLHLRWGCHVLMRCHGGPESTSTPLCLRSAPHRWPHRLVRLSDPLSPCCHGYPLEHLDESRAISYRTQIPQVTQNPGVWSILCVLLMGK
jgi:hypothetical protein